MVEWVAPPPLYVLMFLIKGSSTFDSLHDFIYCIFFEVIPEQRSRSVVCREYESSERSNFPGEIGI